MSARRRSQLSIEATEGENRRLGAMTEKLTPEELLENVSEHDTSALMALYERFSPRMLGLLVRILPSRVAAEEVLRDVFLDLWEGKRRLAGKQISVAAWLMITARATAVERLRAERHLPKTRRSKSDPLQRSLSWMPRPEEIDVLENRCVLLKKILNRLPAPQRRILELAVFEGYTEDEISEILKEPLAKVKNELRASMRFFRHRLHTVLGTWDAII